MLTRKATFMSQSDLARIYLTLEGAILSGKLKPRERLIETELAAELRVNRSLIRRAISELAAKGLVDVVPQKGARVIDIPEEEVEDAYRVRMNLELLAADLVVQRINRASLMSIKQLQEEYVGAVARRAFEEMILKNEEFHRAIYAASENRLLCELLEKVRNVTFPLRYAAYFIPGRAEQSIRDHAEMIEALEKRDLAALRRVVETSVSFPRDTYLSRKQTEDKPAAQGGDEASGEMAGLHPAGTSSPGIVGPLTDDQ
jgi:DNA-binding GntR family transcriptional regulator